MPVQANNDPVAQKRLLAKQILAKQILANSQQNDEAIAQGVPPTSEPVDYGRTAFQMGGATIGALTGAAATGGNPVGGTAGAILGGAGGDLAYNAVNRYAGFSDQRDPAQQMFDAGYAGLTAGAGEGAGAIAGAGLRAGTKAFFRGGEAGRQNVSNAIEDFGVSNSTPTLGQATGGYLTQSIEGYAGRTPGPHGVMLKRAEQTSENIRNATRARGQIMGGQDVEGGGVGINTGIENWRSQFTTEGQVKFNDLTAKLDNGRAPADIANTQAFLEKQTAIDPGAPNVTGGMVNPAWKKMADELQLDVDLNAISGGRLPISALQNLRTKVGAKLSDWTFINDKPRSELLGLYKAITADLKEAAYNRGPEAIRAFNDANDYWTKGMARVDNFLTGLAKKGVEPEKLFGTVFNATKGTTMIRELYSSLSPQEQRATTGSIIKRMGYTGGAEDRWDSFKYFRDWQNIPDKTKDVMFKSDPLMRKDMDKVAASLERQVKQYERFGNPPKTAAGLIGGAMMGGGAIGFYTTGDPSWLVGVAAAGATYWAGARTLLANKAFVHWLARSTKLEAGPAAISNHIGRLSAIAANADPETRDNIQQYLGMVSQAISQDAQRQQQPPEVPKEP